MGRARGAAVGVDAGELDHVAAARSLGQEVSAFVADQVDARIVDPGPEVLTAVLPEQAEDGRVHLHPRDLSGLEAKRGQDVEAAPTPIATTRGGGPARA